ncbi:MAG: M23 family metallopeptidase [Deltaproteobacteria bacterium]|nr:M23 family metallopeptidase [Deltaproteobacteria bacterium]
MPAPQKPPTQLYTVILVSDHSQAVRRFLVPRPWLRRAAWVGGVTGLVALLAMGHYFALLGASSENRVLKEENAQLRSQILLVQEKVAHISSTLDQVERFDAKLRTAVTQLQDPERNAPMPPPGPGAPGSTAAPAPAVGTGPTAAAPAGAPAEEPADRALAPAVPTLWPARGWLTSAFGLRMDPVTSERTMHRGVDIATAPGAPVVAPSDGVVVYAGVDGVLGKVLVLDHGYGVRTRYGHLAEFSVERGQAVKRGTPIAMVGNTGRSTGPHLHYEVQVDGIAENPSRFVRE